MIYFQDAIFIESVHRPHSNIIHHMQLFLMSSVCILCVCNICLIHSKSVLYNVSQPTTSTWRKTFNRFNTQTAAAAANNNNISIYDQSKQSIFIKSDPYIHLYCVYTRINYRTAVRVPCISLTISQITLSCQSISSRLSCVTCARPSPGKPVRPFRARSMSSTTFSRRVRLRNGAVLTLFFWPPPTAGRIRTYCCRWAWSNCCHKREAACCIFRGGAL